MALQYLQGRELVANDAVLREPLTERYGENSELAMEGKGRV